MTERQPEPFLNVLKSLGDAERVPIPLLYHLSDMMPDDFSLFCETWPSLDAERRRVIVRHLADISEENYLVDFGDVFGFCLNDEAPAVRVASLDGLWDSERLSLLAPIVDLMQSDPDVEVRAAAAATLGHYVMMAEWGQIPAAPMEPVVAALLDLLSSDEVEISVRCAALESVAAAGDPRIAAHIEEAYDSGDLPMQVSALFAMGRSADKRWLEIVRDEMTSPVAEMRLEAARAAGGIGHQSVISDLIDLVSDEDLEIRLAAVAALGQIGGETARQFLTIVTDDVGSADLHEAASEALDELDWLGGEIDLSLIDLGADWDSDLPYDS